MTVKIITDFRVLMQKAAALGRAKNTGDKDEIERAQADHDAYKELCLKAESMSTGLTFGDL